MITENISTTKKSLQAKIEAAMKRFGDEERWESIFLFSSEGFPMASYTTSSIYREDDLLEFAFSLTDTIKLVNDDLPAKEISVRSRKRKTIVFRYFDAWDDELILAAVLTGKKGYRRALNQLLKLIRSLG